MSGQFQIGERVFAVTQNTTAGDFDSEIIGRFRICQPNHKVGPFSAPTLTYTNDPYNPAIKYQMHILLHLHYLMLTLHHLLKRHREDFLEE